MYLDLTLDFKALAASAKPRYRTVRKLMDAIGVKMTAQSSVSVEVS
jgi:DNA-binding phage protein